MRILRLRVHGQYPLSAVCFLFTLCAGVRLTHSETTPTLIRVEPGVFVQGSAKQEPGRFDNERPFAASLPYAIWVGSTEVTQHQWLKYVKRNPSFFGNCGGSCPVDSVNWYESLAYANLRSKGESLAPCYQLDGCVGQIGAICGGKSSRLASCEGEYHCKVVNHTMDSCDGYRLLTESEWEHVARAGLVNAHYAVEENQQIADIARYSENAVVGSTGLSCLNGKSACAPTTTGRYQASPWGHYDFHGNLREWVWDGFANYPTGTQTNPRRDAGIERVIRGSSFRSPSHEIRAALRGRLAPRFKNAEVGLRLGRRVVIVNTPRPEKKIKQPPPSPAPKPIKSESLPHIPPGQKIRLNQ